MTTAYTNSRTNHEALDVLRDDNLKRQKKGIHFILASIIIWAVILAVQLTALPQMTKNLFTFCATAPLMPIAFLLSKALHIDFQTQNNPLGKLGLIFTANQMVYLLIAMWIYQAVPEKMLMVLAIIFGAHLMPYSWLYRSKSYMVLSVFIPIMAFVLGLTATPVVLAIAMLITEVIFSIILFLEVTRLES